MAGRTATLRTGKTQARDTLARNTVAKKTQTKAPAAKPVKRVAKPAAQSSIARILELVLTAQKQREPVQRLIDRVSQPYAIGVVARNLWGIAI